MITDEFPPLPAEDPGEQSVPQKTILLWGDPFEMGWMGRESSSGRRKQLEKQRWPDPRPAGRPSGHCPRVTRPLNEGWASFKSCTKDFPFSCQKELLRIRSWLHSQLRLPHRPQGGREGFLGKGPGAAQSVKGARSAQDGRQAPSRPLQR